MIDLETLDTTAAANEGSRMVVTHPITKKPLVDEDGAEAYLLLAGMDSDQWAEIDRQVSERRIERGIANRNMTISGDDMADERMQKLVGCTIEVGNLAIGGAPIDAARPSTVRSMYERLKWLREDAERHMTDRANFLPPGLIGSADTPTQSSVSASGLAGLPSATISPSPDSTREAA